MRLICPHCQQTVTVPDDTAGKPTPCPNCGQSITPPALTGAAIDAAPVPAPPPVASGGREVPGPTDLPKDQGTYAPHAPVIGRSPWLHLTLKREVVRWTAPIALMVALVLTCFTWVAVAPNGTRIYTQNAWQAAGGGFTPDPNGERIMQAEKALRDHTGASVWIILYLIVLIPTTAFAIASLVLVTVPDLFRSVWPHRQSIVVLLCVLLFILLILPMLTGFGLEKGAALAANPPAAAAAGEPTAAETADRELRHDIEVARFGLHRTVWFKLAVLVQFIALAGIGTAWWLDNHPSAPDPRVEVYC